MYVQHSGIMGMHWGHRKASSATAKPKTSKNGTKQGVYDKVYDMHSNSSRKQSTLQTEANLRAKVASNQKEAADRIKFYGGKNVAIDSIQAESRHKQNVRAGFGYTSSLLSGAFGSALVVAGGAAGAAATAGLGAVVVAGGATIAGLTAKGNSYIRKHAKEQISYTNDSKVK